MQTILDEIYDLKRVIDIYNHPKKYWYTRRTGRTVTSCFDAMFKMVLDDYSGIQYVIWTLPYYHWFNSHVKNEWEKLVYFTGFNIVKAGNYRYYYPETNRYLQFVSHDDYMQNPKYKWLSNHIFVNTFGELSENLPVEYRMGGIIT